MKLNQPVVAAMAAATLVTSTACAPQEAAKPTAQIEQNERDAIGRAADSASSAQVDVAEVAAKKASNAARLSAKANSHADTRMVSSSEPLRGSYKKCMDASEGETLSMQNCIEEEWTYQDSRLNEIYSEIKKNLPEKEWIQLRNEQRRWLTELNNDENCKWDANTEGQEQRLMANECSLRKLAVRVKDLEIVLSGLKQSSRPQ